MRPRVWLLMFAVIAAPGIVGAQPAKAPTVAATAQTAVVTMESGGQVTLEFWPDVAPNHVKNFTGLAGKGFYDGQRVHRVEPKFVVQFGDPLSKTASMDDPRVGSGGSGKTLKAEFNKKPFDRGVLGMARTSDPHSAGSQVYLMLGPAHFLNGQYTAFGKVTKGMEVVDKIKVGDRIKSIKVTN